VMAFRKALLAATVLAFPAAAQAQQASGFYIGLGLGLNWLQDSDISLNLAGSALPRGGTASFNPAPAIVGSFGYAYGNGLRGEIEVSYRVNDVDSVTGFGNANGAVTSQGKVRNYGVMLNGFYDFDLGAASWIQPYIGAGVGVMRHNYESVLQTRTVAPADVVAVIGSEWLFGYQAIVGAAFPVPSIGPGLSLTAEYRLMGTLDGSVEANRTSAGTVRRGDADVQNLNHAIFVGIRQMLYTPPPAAPAVAPAAAPVPSRSFIVFFDFDRSNLTDRARQIVAEAAQNAQRAETTRIEVSGHADRAGTVQYNQRLSERRAQTVAAELERNGVPRSAMFIQAFGETRPLVPTADGVREPQNRRVEIVLR